MPGMSYGLPVSHCITGIKLSKIAGSVCSECYAQKGLYKIYEKQVVKAQDRRLYSLSNPLWVEAMIVLLRDQEWFRWHDSGDLQNLSHLEKIVEVCTKTPDTNYWLPTREYGIIKQYMRKNKIIPENLVVRLSENFIDKFSADKIAKKMGCQTSGVSQTKYTCPASLQGNSCGDCRKCWNKDVFSVVYKKH